jgi:hypothetical protein
VGFQKSAWAVTSGDLQPGMIAEVSLRLLYLIISLLLSWLTLLGRSASTSSSSFCATRSPYSAEPTPNRFFALKLGAPLMAPGRHAC